MAKTAIEKRLAALETRGLQPLLRVVPERDGVEAIAEGYLELELVTVITGVPLPVPRNDITLDGLIGEVETTSSEFKPAPAPTENLGDPSPGIGDVAVPHSLDPQIRVIPGYSYVEIGGVLEPVPLLDWIRNC